MKTQSIRKELDGAQKGNEEHLYSWHIVNPVLVVEWLNGDG